MTNKVVHYFYGRCNYDRNPWDNTYKSKTMSKVTCNGCLKRIFQKGLRPRSKFPDHPEFEVAIEGTNLIFQCPVCGQNNYHHLPYGSRTSHCRCWSGYTIVPPRKQE